jgi:lipopolysaccharide export system protein LptA
MSARRAASLACAAAGFMLALGVADSACAQTLNNSFSGLSESSSDPIDIESDVLTVYDAKKYATFAGNVKAVQGTTTLRAAELDVHYVGGSEKLTGQTEESAAEETSTPDAQEGESKEQTQINKIEARGNVIITSEDDQTTTSDWAVYDVPAQLVTVGGNVVLTQGQNVLKGDRLIIDLKTGESRFENTGNTEAGGRIRALFMPKGGPADGGRNKRKRAGPEGSEDSAAPAEVAEPAASESAAEESQSAPDKSLPWAITPQSR